MLIINYKFFFKNLNFFNTKKIYFYLENIFFLFIAPLGDLKWKNSFFFFFEWITYYLKSNLFYFNFNNNNKLKNLFIKKFTYYFLIFCFGFFIKFNVIGLGYKGFISKNIILFKLGYSHFIFLLFSMNIIIRYNKKKKWYIIKGIFLNYIKNSINYILLFRFKNIYNYNGIFKLKTSFFKLNIL